MTVNVYTVPPFNSDTVRGELVPVTVCCSGDDVTLYVITELPLLLLLDALNEIVADCIDSAAVTLVGAPMEDGVVVVVVPVLGAVVVVVPVLGVVVVVPALGVVVVPSLIVDVLAESF